MEKKGKLYLIPTPLGQEGLHTISPHVVEHLHALDIFIAERAKTARHFIKSTKPKRPISVLTIHELNKFTTEAEKRHFLDAATEGKDIGLLSEAGCPGVADPGAEIVQLAHRKGIEVIPLVGPSSILLALMASGMNGQNFAFKGYLPAKRPDLEKALRQVEQFSAKFNQTQIMIETPYRNKGYIEAALKVLRPNTRLCIAADLSLPSQYVFMTTISNWRKTTIPDLHKRPAIFLIHAQ